MFFVAAPAFVCSLLVSCSCCCSSGCHVSAVFVFFFVAVVSHQVFHFFVAFQLCHHLQFFVICQMPNITACCQTSLGSPQFSCLFIVVAAPVCLLLAFFFSFGCCSSGCHVSVAAPVGFVSFLSLCVLCCCCCQQSQSSSVLHSCLFIVVVADQPVCLLHAFFFCSLLLLWLMSCFLSLCVLCCCCCCQLSCSSVLHCIAAVPSSVHCHLSTNQLLMHADAKHHLVLHNVHVGSLWLLQLFVCSLLSCSFVLFFVC